MHKIGGASIIAYRAISIQYPLKLSPRLLLAEKIANICGSFMQKLSRITE